jgi:hypothetical protein
MPEHFMFFIIWLLAALVLASALVYAWHRVSPPT